eukprot:TRINITY_DN25854_c0_g1_i1.p1 TRINITY_DN25854_c0_g1~~TRINITY_DN25854_c0_g1_i1.p1  ORF type:complete len:405 (-),score=-2.23 TRINITY_DN25854_c0_g1_i1:296-1510(-)
MQKRVQNMIQVFLYRFFFSIITIMISAPIYLYVFYLINYLQLNSFHALYQQRNGKYPWSYFTRIRKSEQNLWHPSNQSAWIPAEHCPWGRPKYFEDFWGKCEREQVDVALLRKSEPMLVNTKHATSLFCAIYKSGSTAWKRVVHKANGKSPSIYLTRSGTVHREKATTLGDLNKDKRHDIYNNPHILRWTVVRNPYARLYSSYNEKFVQGKENTKKKYHRYFQLEYKKGVSANFSQLISQLYWLYKSNTTYQGAQKRPNSLVMLDRVDVHFASQLSFCGFQQGFGYDYVLKSELISQWYSSIISILNLTEVVMSGWPDEDNCFLSVPQLQCNGPSLQYQQNQNIEQESTQNRKSSHLHNRRSAQHITQVYTQLDVQLVSEIYNSDLVGLQYPLWDGTQQNFRIV